MKRLRDANGVPIVTDNDNPILNTGVYEVDYLGVHKAELEYNTSTDNIFAQIYNKGNQFMHLDTISDHRVNRE